MGDLWLNMGRGGLFPIRLHDEDSPGNAAALRRILPVRSMARHCTWSGEGFVFMLGGLNPLPERQRMFGIRPGALCIEHYPEGVREVGAWTALLVVCGPRFWFKNPFSPARALCVVGQVTDGLEELEAVGRRVHRFGIEPVVLATKEYTSTDSKHGGMTQ